MNAIITPFKYKTADASKTIRQEGGNRRLSKPVHRYDYTVYHITRIVTLPIRKYITVVIF
jgi:hypothetical protein